MTQHNHPPSPTSTSTTPPIDILILGAGWTSTFLLPLLTSLNLTHAATTRTGHDNTIPFTFNPSSTSPTPYGPLPPAKTILITFPLRDVGQSALLTRLYTLTHPGNEPRWIQLGSTGIFTGKEWNAEDSPYDTKNARAVAEDELLRLLGDRACVLNLAGLYGGERQPRGWVGRVVRTKMEVRGKGALHLVHGRDVARAVVGVCGAWEGVRGRRWIVTDLHVYDWWELIFCWGRDARERVEDTVTDREGLLYERWVVELMREEGVRALPREKESLGRVLDGRGFWEAVGCMPEEGRVS